MTRKAHIVGLSGGKDSTATALRLKELYPNRKYLYVCTPTGDELPEMEIHWNRLESILEQPIIRLHHPDYHTIYDLIEEFWMLPNFRARWCTRILKIEAIQHFYNQVKPAVCYIGLRADEQSRNGFQLLDPYINQSYPLRDWGWGINDVWQYLVKKKIKIHRRTDCGMCFFQRIDEWYSLWEQYPKRYEKYENLEFLIGHSFMAPGKHKIWPNWLFPLRLEFEKGRMPMAVKKVKGQQAQKTLFNSSLDIFDYGINRKCRVCSL